MNKKFTKIINLIVCLVIMVSVFSIAASACPAPNCFSSARTAYCGGGVTTRKTHTFTYYVPFWPFGATTASCNYTYIDHNTYGKCDACGYIYPQGSDVFFPHSGECAHTHEKCNKDKGAVCSNGSVLDWYF